MSMAPQAIHSNLARPHPTDSRLLQNLIKAEKSYIDNLEASSVSGYAAASALAAWGTSEAPDISKASQNLSEILASVSDAQRTHVQALEGYRSALKDVLDREQSIRSVVRDRDILVGRLIKASKKKISKKDSGLSQDEKMEKVNAAQRELHACEQVLASEEAALIGVKRRTFKEALTMRMKTLGDAGSTMVDAAKEAILLLDEFDTHGPLLQVSGGGQHESMYADDGVETGAYDNHALESGYYASHQPAAPQQIHGNSYNASGSPNPANGTNITRDEQGHFHKDLQGKLLFDRTDLFLSNAVSFSELLGVPGLNRTLRTRIGLNKELESSRLIPAARFAAPGQIEAPCTVIFQGRSADAIAHLLSNLALFSLSFVTPLTRFWICLFRPRYTDTLPNRFLKPDGALRCCIA